MVSGSKGKSTAPSDAATTPAPAAAAAACVVCNALVRGEQDVIDLRSEGTGFAGHGTDGLVAVKQDIAFLA